ncbi:MAG: SAM-dependent methyltransferase [Patescibacteria group bacterium]
MIMTDGVRPMPADINEPNLAVPEYPETLDLMLEFIRNQGGRARFDEYMNEHLFSPIGYYSARAEIGEDFRTDAIKPFFARAVGQYLKESCAKDKLPPNILEIGGGNGHFKRNLLQNFPFFSFTAFDKSPKLAKEQEGQVADVTRLPLADGSFEGIIFSNELLDELPCRILQFENKNAGYVAEREERPDIEFDDDLNYSYFPGTPKVKEEGFVEERNGELALEFIPIERNPDGTAADPFIAEYERYLIETRSRVKDGDIISVSDRIRLMMEEMKRVLKRGKILFFDYGFIGEGAGIPRGSKELPYYYNGQNHVDVQDIIKRPYEVDLTHSVDFGYCKWMADSVFGESATVSAGEDRRVYEQIREPHLRNLYQSSPHTFMDHAEEPAGYLEIDVDIEEK